MGQALAVIGVVLQIAGVAIAGVGLWQTWHEFAQGEGFFNPIGQGVGRIGRRITQAVRNGVNRLLGRPQHRVVGVSVADNISITSKVRARVIWGPLPSDPAPALVELDRRTRLLSDALADAIDRHADKLDDVHTAANNLARRVEEATEHIQTQTRRVAIGGIRLEALGLFLVALGLVLQGAGAAIGSPPPAL